MDTNNPVVKIDHLKFNYKKHIVFEDLSLELEPGRIYGLLGENGVGKTTLLRIICGLLRAKEGSCTVDGIPSATSTTYPRSSSPPPSASTHSPRAIPCSTPAGTPPSSRNSA